jgi:hypothetical protein
MTLSCRASAAGTHDRGAVGIVRASVRQERRGAPTSGEARVAGRRRLADRAHGARLDRQTWARW